jgi:hypothetical protein
MCPAFRRFLRHLANADNNEDQTWVVLKMNGDNLWKEKQILKAAHGYSVWEPIVIV